MLKIRNKNISKRLSFFVISLTVLIFALFNYINLSHHNEKSLNLIKAAPPEKSLTLYMYIKPLESGLFIEAKFESQVISFEVDAIPATELRDFLDITCQSSNHEYKEIEPQLKLYGRKLFDPVQSYIEQCNEIEFVLADDVLIPCPFDLLFFQDEPLFVQKPIVYSFEPVGPRKIDLKKISHALLISDETADPERAVLKVRKYINKSIYKDIAAISPADFEKAGPVDLLLISAHGHIFADREDYMDFGEERLKAENLSNMKPKLVYFDSCFMGASADFIKLFRSGGTDFYVASLVPNEAGNSSTKTMCLFFEALDLYHCPAYAMYLTRKQLYEHFSKNGTNFMLFYRSFPFRVYRFN